MSLLMENMDLTQTPNVITGPISLSWFTMTLTQSVERGTEWLTTFGMSWYGSSLDPWEGPTLLTAHNQKECVFC